MRLGRGYLKSKTIILFCNLYQIKIYAIEHWLRLKPADIINLLKEVSLKNKINKHNILDNKIICTSGMQLQNCFWQNKQDNII